MIKIGDTTIGGDAPTFIVAEGACNHMGDMETAKEMTRQAAKAGADAIKWQAHKAERLTTAHAKPFWDTDETSQLDYYRKLDGFGRDEYAELFEYADQLGIIAFCTPFDVESVKMLDELDMPLFKVASADITNIPLSLAIRRTAKPVILSTGASTRNEIDAALTYLYPSQVVLMACTLSYPTAPDKANLNRIRTLKTFYPHHVVGLSDHTLPEAYAPIPALAVALGAGVIEKHYTLDRDMPGSGHFFAATPSKLQHMVRLIRTTEDALGHGALGVMDIERLAYEQARRSIVANEDIPKGATIGKWMLALKRPGTGMPPNKVGDVVGKKATRDIAADTLIGLEMLG